MWDRSAWPVSTKNVGISWSSVGLQSHHSVLFLAMCNPYCKWFSVNLLPIFLQASFPVVVALPILLAKLMIAIIIMIMVTCSSENVKIVIAFLCSFFYHFIQSFRFLVTEKNSGSSCFAILNIFVNYLITLLMLFLSLIYVVLLTINAYFFTVYNYIHISFSPSFSFLASS